MHAIWCHKKQKTTLFYLLNMILTFRTLLTQRAHNLYANPSAGTHLILQCICSFPLVVAEQHSGGFQQYVLRLTDTHSITFFASHGILQVFAN